MASNKGDALVTAGVLMLMAMLVLQEVRDPLPFNKVGSSVAWPPISVLGPGTPPLSSRSVIASPGRQIRFNSDLMEAEKWKLGNEFEAAV
ncbi:hypothetical protein LINPERPRIM_LOCUS16480 [Linum perenne]